MRRRSVPYEKLAALAIVVALAATVVAFYLVCLVAVQLSVLFLSMQSDDVEPQGSQTDARAAGIGAALIVGTLWMATFVIACSIALGASSGWVVGLIIGAPVSCVVGWQTAGWQEAFSWSHKRGALALGAWTSGRFFIRRRYTVTPLERTKHLVCSGATGTGKSTLIRNLVLQDIRAGAGVCVIDPKDDLVDGILPHVPETRHNDVIIFDAADRERPLGLNPFANIPLAQRSLAASEILAVFRRYFVDAWGARLEHVLRNVILALLEVRGATLADVPRVLLDEAYLHWVVGQLTNPAVREFFLVEYEQVLRRRSDAIEPILNKVGPWLSYPELRNIISQPESSFDVRQVMDEGKVLFVRIPQGVFGEDVSNLLGALIVARVQLAAQSRAEMPAAARRPFFLYVDEFQNFATSSFAKIVTEARAFNVGLVCVNQYPEQLTRELQLALVKNAATFVQSVYRGGRYLLEVMRQEDMGEKKPRVRIVTPPSPPGAGDPVCAKRLRELSRQRYGRAPSDEPLIDVVTAASAKDGPTQRSPWGSDIDEE